ncbi:MAG: thioredoxin family protein [Chthonomonadales bacterium]
MDREVFTSDKVVDFASRMIAVKIDTDKNMKLARRYGVEGLPTVIFFDGRGQRLHQIEGSMPAEAFVKEMKTALARAASLNGKPGRAPASARRK